jgi:hypothetical protein
MTPAPSAMRRDRMIGAGIAFGLAAGSLISIFLGDFGFWIALGICVGVAGGAACAKLAIHREANDGSPRTDG